MGHVFISYSHKDTKYAHELANVLSNRRISVWIDERLDYGSQWPSEIQRQLDSCDAFILVMTPLSFESDWVQSELQRAKRKLKPIFPLLLKGDEPWLSVESTQYYDVRSGDFPDERFYSALERVLVTSQNGSTAGNLKGSNSQKTNYNSTSKLKTKLILGIAGVLIAAFVAWVIVTGGFGILNPEPASPPSSPMPVGTWNISANGYQGILEITSIDDNGRIIGSVFGDSIDGTWNDALQKVNFTRANSTELNVYQLFEGTQIDQEGHYILRGDLFDHRTDGTIETVSWTATR